MRILILGGTGFIGQGLTERLLERGHTISLVVHKRLPEKLAKIKAKNRTKADDDGKFKIFNGDILDKNILVEAFKRQDVVVNLVGQICKDKNMFYDLNIFGALNVLELCIENKVKNMILISSCLVYGESGETPSKEVDPPNPKTNYSLTKLMAEKIYTYFAKKHGFNLSILRLSNVYGPNKRSGTIYNFIETLKNGKDLIINGDGRQKRDFIYIDDVVDGVVMDVENMPKGIEVFNISTSKRTDLLQLVSIIEKELKKKAKLKFAEVNSYDERCVWADYTKAEKAFNFYPKINLKEGLKRTINGEDR